MPRYTSQYDPASAPHDLEHLLYEKREHVAYVTINRPDRLNALHTFAYQELRACWVDIARDPKIRCAIVTGSGERAFCAGRDVKFLAEHQGANVRTPHENPSSPHYVWGGGGLPSDVGLEKPLICALNGLAVGIGLTLVLQCHLRVMAQSAWIGDQHTNIGRLGAPHEIYNAIPRTAAAYLTLCNGRLDAEDCLRLGIVNQVVAGDEVVSAAEGLASMISRSSPTAVRASVRLFNLAAEPSPALTQFARHLDQELGESDECAEGARAFAEKREPVWGDV